MQYIVLCAGTREYAINSTLYERHATTSIFTKISLNQDDETRHGVEKDVEGRYLLTHVPLPIVRTCDQWVAQQRDSEVIEYLEEDDDDDDDDGDVTAKRPRKDTALSGAVSWHERLTLVALRTTLTHLDALSMDVMASEGRRALDAVDRYHYVGEPTLCVRSHKLLLAYSVCEWERSDAASLRRLRERSREMDAVSFDGARLRATLRGRRVVARLDAPESLCEPDSLRQRYRLYVDASLDDAGYNRRFVRETNHYGPHVDRLAERLATVVRERTENSLDGQRALQMLWLTLERLGVRRDSPLGVLHALRHDFSAEWAFMFERCVNETLRRAVGRAEHLDILMDVLLADMLGLFHSTCEWNRLSTSHLFVEFMDDETDEHVRFEEPGMLVDALRAILPAHYSANPVAWLRREEVEQRACRSIRYNGGGVHRRVIEDPE